MQGFTDELVGYRANPFSLLRVEVTHPLPA
jgi:hypothetical protein